ncbi:MotA/TolQ/ExbB proton channel family protein [Psychrobium sp. nBUS_13]|uniref:MotA/TolQ/ExbB proton channel family protein n=1 Tax=Psychrobium sp. nBUS_13 TaxID=3395319 RepID=UPI003EB78DC9
MKYLSASLLFLTLAYSHVSVASVESDLVNDIKKAQTALNKTQSNIAKQSAQLNRQTHDAEQAVVSLRKKTSAARRLMDEQTLSLTTLEKRLATWQQQDTYQRNLLARFSQQQKMPQSTGDAFSNESLATLSSAFNRLRSHLNPQWQTTSVVAQDGAIKPLSTLAIGPVSWFIDQTNQQAGFLAHEPTMTKQGLLLGNDEFKQLNLLAKGQQAQISFDPTLTRALKIAQSQESVVSHVEKGGIWVLPIIAFGIFALLISLAKGAQLIRLPTLLPALAERLSHIDGNDASQLNQFAEQVKGMQRQLIDITLKSPPGQQRDDQLFSALLMQKHTLEYWLGAIAITAAVSPLLGLLGTVSGMIETFKLMTLFGAGDASAVSGGISEALVTTELGLVVAIPALLMHALLSRKVKTYYGGLESCAVQLSQTSTKSLPKAA